MLDSLLRTLLPLLLASLVTVTVFGRLKIPSPLAYVSVWLALGPSSAGAVEHTQETLWCEDVARTNLKQNTTVALGRFRAIGRPSANERLRC